jgi:Tol biopolymer transport system component
MAIRDLQWHQLTRGPASDLHPAWSPDGTRIAFVSDRDGDWEIYVINVDGTGIRQLTFNDDWDSYPDWSPSGTQLAYTSRQDGNYDLYVVDVSSGAVRRLTTNPHTDAHPAWSPGGQHIAYTVVIAQGGTLRREIGILDLEDLSYTRRTPFSRQGRALYSFPDWSPDGRWIVFTSEVDGDQEIYLAPMDGELMVNLSDAPAVSDFGPVW